MEDLSFHLDKLPLEISQRILESHVESCLSPMDYNGMSKQVQRWVDAALYGHIALDTREKGTLFHRTVCSILAGSSAKPGNFLTTHVKALFFNYTIEPSDIQPIIQACDGVTSLACYIPEMHTSPELRDFIAAPTSLCHLTRISIPPSMVPSGERDFSQQIFQSLTHLEVLYEEEEGWDWSGLANLLHLTHLCVDTCFAFGDQPSTEAVDFVKEILSSCPPSLRVFIISMEMEAADEDDYEAEIKAIHEGRVDPRAVVIQPVGTPEQVEELHPGCVLGMTRDDFEKTWTWTTPNNLWDVAERWMETRKTPAPGESSEEL